MARCVVLFSPTSHAIAVVLLPSSHARQFHIVLVFTPVSPRSFQLLQVSIVHHFESQKVPSINKLVLSQKIFFSCHVEVSRDTLEVWSIGKVSFFQCLCGGPTWATERTRVQNARVLIWDKRDH